MAKQRKQVYSATLPKDLVDRAVAVAGDKSFSQFVRDALENYIKLIESQAKQ